MIRNYLKTAIRSLLKYKGYSVINVLGLVVGISSCILICIYVQSELNYDQFHAKADQIYRIHNFYKPPFGTQGYPTITPAMPVAITQGNEGVLDFVRLVQLGNNNNVVVRIDEDFFKQKNTFAADASFFTIFSFKLKEGNRETALLNPHTVVLSEAVARKFFGEQDGMGKTLIINDFDNQSFKVTGVMETMPANSHFHADILVSMATVEVVNPEANLDENWTGDGFYSYLLLDKKQSPKAVIDQMKKLAEANLDGEDINRVNATLMPLADIHLHSNLLNEIEPNGSMTQVYIFIAVATFILLIAVINYMNLATARSARRAREVGMRKTLGATRYQLIAQFLSESVFLTFFATMLSIVLAYLYLPYFNNLTGKEIELSIFNNPLLLAILAGIIVLVGFASGSYPALFLSSFKPVVVLKGKLAAGMNSSPFSRKGLVTFQFMVSTVLIICTWLVYNQLNYLKNKNLGFNKEHVVVVDNTGNAITSKLNTFKTELSKNTNVKNATASLSIPGGLRPITFVKSDGMADEEKASMVLINIDFEYMKTMDISIQEGRDFDPDIISGSTQAVILNQQAVDELRLKGNPVGQFIRTQNPTNDEFEEKKVIGVIEDINFEPLYRRIEPAFFATVLPLYNYVFVRILPEDRAETVAYIRKVWEEMVPEQPFSYTFLDDNLNQLYVAEQKLGQLITYFSVLAVIVACLGLFGLASFATDQRRKEIGIRKVLGSSNTKIVLLLFKEYTVIILIANLIAWPLAYYLAGLWMNNFVFNTGINLFVFVFAALLVFIIAVITVCSKAIKAALDNPVNALRSE